MIVLSCVMNSIILPPYKCHKPYISSSLLNYPPFSANLHNFTVLSSVVIKVCLISSHSRAWRLASSLVIAWMKSHIAHSTVIVCAPVWASWAPAVQDFWKYYKISHEFLKCMKSSWRELLLLLKTRGFLLYYCFRREPDRAEYFPACPKTTGIGAWPGVQQRSVADITDLSFLQ